jgi:hypothetical protein
MSENKGCDETKVTEGEAQELKQIKDGFDLTERTVVDEIELVNRH